MLIILELIKKGVSYSYACKTTLMVILAKITRLVNEEITNRLNAPGIVPGVKIRTVQEKFDLTLSSCCRE